MTDRRPNTSVHVSAPRRSGRLSVAQGIVIRHAEGYLLHAQVTLAPVTDVENGGSGSGSDCGKVVHYVAVLRSLR